MTSSMSIAFAAMRALSQTIERSDHDDWSRGSASNQGLFAPLLRTKLARTYLLAAIDLPGFGAPPLAGRTTLDRLAEFVDREARRLSAKMVLAHSVASIIASLAAQRAGSPINTIVSLEGNLTADDAYFSGTAGGFDDPGEFRAAFLARLAELAQADVNISRYRAAVETADARALWQLGVDVQAFSAKQTPGVVLTRTPRAAYFYNPDNLSAASLVWLETSSLNRTWLPGASHWICFDQPDLLAGHILAGLATA
ncbi:MAG: alpha/beta hydrolase [Rhodospirillales bacterium]|nr:alpha/beta hydrolase [Rhodospirillales bacterium]